MPNLFRKPAFGLDISDSSIEALQLERKLGKLYLGGYGRIELEKGLVEDGKIFNKEKLKEKIIELLKNTIPKRFKTDRVILSLPESKTFLHILKLPVNILEKELVNAVESQALKTIPLDPNRIYFDFQVISRTNEFQEILYVATFKEIVSEYLELLKDAGLKPLILDVESASLTRAFKNEEIRDGGMLIADIGARTTILTIFDEGLVRLSAIVPSAGDHWTRAISEKLDVSLEEAEKFKKTYGLDPEKKEGEIMLILQSLLQNILEEIRKLIRFYEAKSGRTIKKILLCGGSSFIPNLPSYFASNLGIETSVPDPWKGINVEKLFKKKQLRKIITTRLHPIFFANVIGLAKRGLEKDFETTGINLIPVEKRPKPTFIGRKLSKSKVFSFLIIGLATAAFAFLGWIIYNYIVKVL